MRRPGSWLKRHKRKLLVAVVALSVLYSWARWGPMDPLFNTPRSTVLLARDGQLLGAATATDGQWRFPGSGPLPPRFVTCLLQFEDRHFYDHCGVRPQSIARALRQNSRAGRTVSGGSTITMQVARMARGTKDRGYMDKLVEALLALRIETRMDKDSILALYAHNAPFGGNVVGLDAAAWRWFGRAPDRLSWAESATLAVLPNAPSTVHPGKGRKTLRAKRDRLLARLLAIGAIDRTEWSLATEEPLPDKPLPLPRSAPHLLATLMEHGHAGERIRSTLDPVLQHSLLEVAERYAARLFANEVHNAAALILDVGTGEVRAYMGNLASAGAHHAPHVDIIRAQRSTGSLLKPFLYADMLGCGELLPDMLTADVPTRYDGLMPRNADERYNGAVPASEALARSLNVPAVRWLHAHGIARTLTMLRNLGFRTIDRPAEHYGLSLIIGGAESNLWEIAGAYASMARLLKDHGSAGENYRSDEIHAPRVLQDGTDDPTPEGPERPPLSPAAIHFTLKALREVNRPADEQGWRAFADGERIAWKTGTSTGHRDAWAVGLSDRWCVAVWTGNASGEGRPGLTGTLAAAPLMFDLFGLLGREVPQVRSLWDPPMDDMARVPICPASGHIASIDCPVADSVQIPVQGVRTAPYVYHQRIQVDESGRYRVAPGQGHTTAWFVLPPAMERYYAPAHPSYQRLPPFRDGRPTDGTAMEVLYPEPGGRLLIPTELDGTRGKAVIEVAHRDPAARLYWDMDGVYLGTTTGDHRMAIDPADGPHTLTLTDDQGHVLRHSFAVSGHRRR